MCPGWRPTKTTRTTTTPLGSSRYLLRGRHSLDGARRDSDRLEGRSTLVGRSLFPGLGLLAMLQVCFRTAVSFHGVLGTRTLFVGLAETNVLGFDRVLGTKMGVRAVESLMEGVSGKMIGIDNGKIVLTSLKKAIKGETKIDPELIRVSKIMNI